MKSTLRRATWMLCSVLIACSANAQYYGAPQAGSYGGGFGGQLSGSPMGVSGGYGYGGGAAYSGGGYSGGMMGSGTTMPLPQSAPNTSLFSSGTPSFEGSGSRGSAYGAPSAAGMSNATIAAPAATTVQTGPITGPVTGPVVSSPEVTAPLSGAVSMEAAPMAAGPIAQPMVAQPIYGQVTGTQFGAPYMDAMSAGHWEPVYGQTATGGSRAPRWFGGIYGLIMDRDDENPCLLYTSPSPRDATLSRMPSSA